MEDKEKAKGDNHNAKCTLLVAVIIIIMLTKHIMVFSESGSCGFLSPSRIIYSTVSSWLQENQSCVRTERESNRSKKKQNRYR